MSVPNVIEQKRVQDKAKNSENTYHSHKNNRYSEKEIKEKRTEDVRLRKSVSLNTSTVNYYRAWMDISKQIPDLNFICYSYISPDNVGKGRFQFTNIPLKDAADKVAILTNGGFLCWELRRSGMMVLRVRFGDDVPGWGP